MSQCFETEKIQEIQIVKIHFKRTFCDFFQLFSSLSIFFFKQNIFFIDYKDILGTF